MKKHTVLVATLTLLLLGCAEPNKQQQANQPVLKSENERDPSVPIQHKPISCDFSTTVATTAFPTMVWPGSLTPSKNIALKSETAMGGFTAFFSTTMTDFSKSKRQKEICEQIENEFTGFNNPYYRRQHYIEEYSVARLNETTKNLVANEYIEISPDKSYFAVEYPDPKGNTSTPIKVKSIPINIRCKTAAKVSSNDYYGYFQFKHSHQCDFNAIDQDYTLNSGEKIKISITGSLTSYEDNRLKLTVKDVSWRDVN